MKEIREIYLTQKKKEARRHRNWIGLAVVLLGVASFLKNKYEKRNNYRRMK